MANNLRDEAIAAGIEALRCHEWRQPHRDSAHALHIIDASCAVCTGDLERIVPVVLDAADAALAAVADGVTS